MSLDQSVTVTGSLFLMNKKPSKPLKLSHFQSASKTPFKLNFAGGQIVIWPQGYKTFFMLNLKEDEIYHAHKC